MTVRSEVPSIDEIISELERLTERIRKRNFVQVASEAHYTLGKIQTDIANRYLVEVKRESEVTG